MRHWRRGEFESIHNRFVVRKFLDWSEISANPDVIVKTVGENDPRGDHRSIDQELAFVARQIPKGGYPTAAHFRGCLRSGLTIKSFHECLIYDTLSWNCCQAQDHNSAILMFGSTDSVGHPSMVGPIPLVARQCVSALLCGKSLDVLISVNRKLSQKKKGQSERKAIEPHLRSAMGAL